MGTRTRWLACVLVGGLLLTPATVRAQDNPGANYRSPQFQWPLPLMWGDRDEGPYFAAEALWYRLNNPLKYQALAYRGFYDTNGFLRGDPFSAIISVTDGDNANNFINNFFSQQGTPGQFYGTHEVALATQDVGADKFTPGYKFNVGYRFRNGVAFELSYMQLTEINHNASAGILPFSQNGGQDSSNLFLTSPFWNVSPLLAGPDRDVLSSFVPVPPGTGNFTVAVSVGGTNGVNVTAGEMADLRNFHGLPLSAFGIWNAAEQMYIRLTQNFASGEANFRFPFYQDENCRSYWLCGARYFKIEEKFWFRTVDEDILGQERPEWAANYTNKISQHLYGGQYGIGNEVYLGGGWALGVEGRVGAFYADRTAEAKVERGDKEIAWSHVRKDQGFSPMFSAGAYLWWYPIDGVQIRAGYEFLGLFNVLRSPHPVAFDVGTLQPEYKGEFLRLDGANIGISFIF